MIARCLSAMGGGDADTVASRLRAFQAILAMVIATEYWAKGIRDRALMEPFDWGAVAAATVLAAAVLHGRHRRPAFVGFVLLQAVWIAQYFPLAGNHRYLELVFAGLFAVLDVERRDERDLMLRAVRWITVVVLFAAGLQKFVHGYWFRGQFLAWSLWRESFATALGPLLSADEFARLTTTGAAAGDGPYVLSNPVLRLVSNGVWIAQLALASLLVPRATRTVAWIVAVVFVLVTEFVARELMFGVEFAAALMLFARTDVLRRLVVPAALLLGLLLAMRTGFFPAVLFH